MKAPKPTPKTRILIIESLVKLETVREYENFLTATVGTLHEDGTPRNWHRPYFDACIKGDTGGFTLRAFPHDPQREGHEFLPLYSAPAIQSSNVIEYKDVVSALNAFDARLTKMNRAEGFSTTQHQHIVRLIRALNVAAVYSRPRNEACDWLHQGDWKIESIADFANRFAMFIKPRAVAIA